MIRYEGKRIGFTAGNFDLLHPGYIYTFETAKQYCDWFIVFLQRDPSLHRKSKYKPVIPVYERYKTLMSIKYIDEVFIYHDSEKKNWYAKSGHTRGFVTLIKQVISGLHSDMPALFSSDPLPEEEPPKGSDPK